MLNYLTLIFCCQLAGEFIIGATDLSIPGPVLGMVILFCFLLVRGSIPDDLSSVADGLLNHLSLLFVPAGVGIMLHFKLLGDDLFAISAALIVSTVLTVIVTAVLMRSFSNGSKEIASDEADHE